MSTPNRTNFSQVVGILGNDWNPDYQSGAPTPGTPSLQPYIDVASLLVDQVIINAAKVGSGYVFPNSVPFGGSFNSPTLTLMEAWLSAHFYMVMQGDYAARKGEGASADFASDKQGAMGVPSTLYGQTAINIDSSRVLYQMASIPPKVARLYFVGGPCCR